MVLYLMYVVLVLLVTVGGLLALAFSTRDIRDDSGFAFDIASALVIGLFVAVLAWTTVL